MRRKTKLTVNEEPLDLGLQPDVGRLVLLNGHSLEQESHTYWTVSIPLHSLRIHIERVMSTAADRGNYKVLIESFSHLHTIDGGDMFPRYYFDWNRMMLELTDWLNARQIDEKHTKVRETPLEL